MLGEAAAFRKRPFDNRVSSLNVKISHFVRSIFIGQFGISWCVCQRQNPDMTVLPHPRAPVTLTWLE